jgi:uncharacterized protein with NRDE domain
MCVLALAWKAHPRWRLVVAGNRDELHVRPTAPLRRWEDQPDLLAGQDLQSGGTWLGISEEGRFAVVTNLRSDGAPKPEAPSRGVLLRDLLAGAGRFATLTDLDLTLFSPFNLLTVIEDALVFSTNQPIPKQNPLTAGVYGLSNGMLDEPWPKTVRLKSILAEWLAGSAADPQGLLPGLAEDRLAQEGAEISPIFVRNPVYGTRCSSIVAIDGAGLGVFIERRFDAQGSPTGETRLEFSWPGAMASG